MYRKTLVSFAFVCGLLLLAAPIVGAVPLLQLDIVGGSYDMGSETIVSGEDSFVLAALLTPNGTVVNEDGTIEDADPRIDWLSLPYYISIAVTPQTGTDMTLGTVDFDGDTINVTGDMVYGRPPLDSLLANKDLPPHDIFDTYFTETEGFFFDASEVVPTYNTQDRAIDGFMTAESGFSYYLTFSVDVANLDPEYGVHFDLYNLTSDIIIINGGGNENTKDIKVFAPFSHDAGTRRVPEPGTLVLLGMGMLGLAAFRRKLR